MISGERGSDAVWASAADAVSVRATVTVATIDRYDVNTITPLSPRLRPAPTVGSPSWRESRAE